MSQIKYVQLIQNTSFVAVEGGYGEQRTQFTAGDTCSLTHREGVGIDVYLSAVGGNRARAFTIPWQQISYVEWVVREKKVAA